MKDQLQVADEVERSARRAGAASAEVLVTTDRRVSLTNRSAAIAREETSVVQLRVLDQRGRVGMARGDRSDDLVEQALARAAVSDTVGVIPPRLDINARGLGILDHRHPNLSDEDRREAVDWNVESCEGIDKSVVVGELTYEEVRQTRVYLSSGGRNATEDSTRYRLSASARRRGAAKSDSFHAVNTSRNFAEVASQPLGVALGRRVLRSANSAPVPSDPMPILLAQPVVAELLPRLLRGFRAERIDKGMGFVTRHAGDAIASSVLHVVDDARLTGGFATRAFDDRGVPSVDMALVREGLLGGVYQGPESAAAADTRPSGHETFDGGLWMGNLIVRPGSRSRNMLLPDMGRVAEIEELAGPISVNELTGALSFSGRVYLKDVAEDAGYIGVLRMETTIVALLGAVVQVCSDHERHGIVDSPTWILDGIWFTG